MKKATVQGVLAFVFVVFAQALFLLIVLKELGGNEALFLIIGYVFAWVNMIVIYYFRKKPPTPPEPPST